MPFLLFNLPAELRLQIYSYALAPTGTLALSSTKAKRHSVVPIIAPNLLRASRQIHREASPILYTDNIVLIAADCHETCWPLISDTKLPPTARVKLEHLMLVCVCVGRFRAQYQDVDFEALQSFTALKTLEVAVIKPAQTASLDLADLLQEILSRMPKTAKVRFCSGFHGRSPEQADFLSQSNTEASKKFESFLAMTVDPPRRPGFLDMSCFAIPSKDLYQAAMDLDPTLRCCTVDLGEVPTTPSSL
ncbi:hypothetical protein K431DRAFT_289452 [Polychaeton citri CBS 116435]|uniref:F-box domain-containing protein n=1 Tax=Polychaeton citri CBS 116435 TaxID=1314669 RepID=A0A9P4Q116_9PEZI|nr:hypothetical protein K431DRAFT_289452 [Polychaeton citri CBS 116435]